MTWRSEKLRISFVLEKEGMKIMMAAMHNFSSDLYFHTNDLEEEECPTFSGLAE